jgi:hypothetical protein
MFSGTLHLIYVNKLYTPVIQPKTLTQITQNIKFNTQKLNVIQLTTKLSMVNLTKDYHPYC